ncbi:hypothetical protein WA158_000172 [Blastocystis sp. Blastoise]
MLKNTSQKVVGPIQLFSMNAVYIKGTKAEFQRFVNKKCALYLTTESAIIAFEYTNQKAILPLQWLTNFEENAANHLIGFTLTIGDKKEAFYFEIQPTQKKTASETFSGFRQAMQYCIQQRQKRNTLATNQAVQASRAPPAAAAQNNTNTINNAQSQQYINQTQNQSQNCVPVTNQQVPQQQPIKQENPPNSVSQGTQTSIQTVNKQNEEKQKIRLENLVDLKAKIIASDPNIQDMYESLVIEGGLDDASFWKFREIQRRQEMLNVLKDEGITSEVLYELDSVDPYNQPNTFYISPEAKRQIFKHYPEVKRVFDSYVTDSKKEIEFWIKFLLKYSPYYKSHLTLNDIDIPSKAQYNLDIYTDTQYEYKKPRQYEYTMSQEIKSDMSFSDILSSTTKHSDIILNQDPHILDETGTQIPIRTNMDQIVEPIDLNVNRGEEIEIEEEEKKREDTYKEIYMPHDYNEMVMKDQGDSHGNNSFYSQNDNTPTPNEIEEFQKSIIAGMSTIQASHALDRDLTSLMQTIERESKKNDSDLSALENPQIEEKLIVYKRKLNCILKYFYELLDIKNLQKLTQIKQLIINIQTQLNNDPVVNDRNYLSRYTTAIRSMRGQIDKALSKVI